MNSEQYVFLGGHRKCGTTLLLNLFDGHEQCCVYPTDISVLYGYFPYFTKEQHSTQERLDRLDRVIFRTLEDLGQRHDIVDLCLQVRKMRKHFFESVDLARLTEIDYIIRQMVGSFRVGFNKPIERFPVTVLKETSLEIYARELASYFDNARFIELVRDPRDNYAALLAGVNKHYSLFGESEKGLLASLLHRVGLSLRLRDNNIEMLGENRFLSIRFEDLTTNLDTYTDKITDWLGISSSVCFERPTVLGCSTSGNNYDGDKLTKVSHRNVGRWRERISPFEAQVIEFYLGDLMEGLGYKCAYERETSSEAASEFYKWANYKYFFKDSFG